jgi:hypothetical protein
MEGRGSLRVDIHGKLELHETDQGQDLESHRFVWQNSIIGVEKDGEEEVSAQVRL